MKQDEIRNLRMGRTVRNKNKKYVDLDNKIKQLREQFSTEMLTRVEYLDQIAMCLNKTMPSSFDHDDDDA